MHTYVFVYGDICLANMTCVCELPSGDGAGVGKGRIIAGIIYQNYLEGRKKSLWLSVSNDLKFDAIRLVSLSTSFGSSLSGCAEIAQ